MDFSFARGHDAHHDDDHDHDAPPQKIALTRREFLKGAGILTGTIAATSVLSVLAPSRVWAVELKTLSTAQGADLLAMAKTLYPHKGLPDAVYALLPKDLDAEAAKDPALAKLLKEGTAALDKSVGGDFAKASEARRLAAAKAMEGTPFFNTVRGKCITSLYDNDMAFAHFGYPGPSFDKGGYILRGFNDLKWLPSPSPSASPPPYNPAA